VTSRDAAALIERLRAGEQTVATAESLTGGALVSRLVDVPGASHAVRGGIVAYATDVKRTVLGVDGALLDAHGAVHPDVAAQMAEGVRRVLGADIGIATTGIAGPESPDGQPVGRVHIAVATAAATLVVTRDLTGDREQIRAETVRQAIAATRDALS